jgi:phage tail-like protein
MARPSSKDPLDKFRWGVNIEGFTRLGFSACETPSVAINTQSYPEGGSHLYPKKIIDSIEYKPVTLMRGVSSDLNFHEWVIQFEELIRGRRNNSSGFPPGSYRKTVVIDHLDRAGRIVKTYTLYNAFPIEYKPASDFSSDADDTISMEKLVLAYESFDVVRGPTGSGKESNPFDIRDIIKRSTNRLF